MPETELDKHLRSGTAYIDAKNLDPTSNPEDGLVDHGDPIVVKAWPTRDEAAAFEASLPLPLRVREAHVLKEAKEERKGERFRLLMENKFEPPVPQKAKRNLVVGNEALLASFLFAVLISALAWSSLPLFGWVLAAVGVYLDQHYGPDDD